MASITAKKGTAPVILQIGENEASANSDLESFIPENLLIQVLSVDLDEQNCNHPGSLQHILSRRGSKP